MKMLLVVYNQAVDEDVVAALKEAGVVGYTKMVDAQGEGTETSPKLGTHSWPGGNNTLFLVVSEERLPQFIGVVRQLKADHPRAGIRGFVFPVESIV